jgi:chromate reductase, NAD(P)H dehydrogenase (quinone)
MKSNTIKLTAISGSLREASINSALLRAAARLAPASVELRVFDGVGALPLFNPDLEARLPPEVAALHAAVAEADAIVIASPEYAHGVTGVIKNTLDWLVSFEPFVGKHVAVLNASPRAHHADAALRETLKTMSANIVESASVSIPLLGAKLDEDAMVEDAQVSSAIRRALANLQQAISSPTIAEVAVSWIHGWVLSRQTPAATDRGTHFTIEVGAPGHMVRHVFPTFDADALEGLANADCADGTWLKVLAPQEAVTPRLPAKWTLHEREYLMHTVLGDGLPAADAPKVHFERNGDVITATLLGPGGDAAARAKAAVVGTAAIFDQVVTEPTHRRQGYGSMLMSALASECRSRGATTGILVATEQGRLLYSALGWVVTSEVTAASYALPAPA